MNDPKVLQIIAEKACQFDRAHFDDDVLVVIDSLLANHERLPTDRKLITRLRPRYAVALGFFEGYALAIEDGDELRSGPFIEHLRMLVEAKPHEGLLAALERVRKEHSEFRRSIRKALGDDVESTGSLDGDVRALVKEWKELKTKLAEAERDRYKRETTESKNQANIGIVIKPPPPPPAAPPAPNELRTEIDDELVQAAAEYANDEEGYPTTARDIDEVHDAMKAGKGWYAVARAFVHGARWQLSRIENAHAGDDPTMHLSTAFDRVPMPSDREIAELVCRTIYSGTETSEAFIRRIVDEIKGDDPESIRRKAVTTHGSVGEACSIKFALLHFRDRLIGPTNQSSIPSDEEIARFCVRWIGPHWDSRDLRAAQDDLASPKHCISYATAMRAALNHFGGSSGQTANEVQNAERMQYETTIRQKNERIAELEKQLGFDCIGGTEKGEGVEAKLELEIQKQNDLLRLQNADLNKAQSRIAELEEQLKDEIENLNETARENVKLANDAIELRAAITGYFQNEHRSSSASLAARNHLRSLVGLSSIRSATPVSGNPGSGELYVENGNVMFRNASGTETVVGRPESEPDACNAIVFRDDAESDYWEEMSYILATKKDTTSQSVATGADEMVEERRKRLSIRDVPENGTHPVVEVTDELLLEAARFANKENGDPEHDNDIASARESIALSATNAWSVFVRGYVNGAQRSSRKP